MISLNFFAKSTVILCKMWYNGFTIKLQGGLYAMRQTVSLKKQYQIVDDLLYQRIHKLLPKLMEETGYDMWIILCREYNEDPVFTTMLPSLCLTARRLSCLVFVKQGERFEALNFGRPSEHLNRVYTQGYTDSSRDQLEMLAEYVR